MREYPHFIMQKNGIVYIALGIDYLNMALDSMQSIFDTYSIFGEFPNFRIFTDIELPLDNLVVNAPGFIEYINTDEYPDKSIATAYLKTQLYNLSPFDKTLYLDCDTKIVGDISDIWSCADDFIAVAPAFNPIKENTFYSDPETKHTQYCLSVIGDFLQYNTGVFLFQKCASTQIEFDVWKMQWEEYRHHENMAFTRMVAMGMPVKELPHEYNSFYPLATNNDRIIHYIAHTKKYLKDA
jgi:lipopolysaccharide biosynthesis glycosyltransferase